MGSNNVYEHYSFSNELMNIDKSVNELDIQLNKVIEEIKKLQQLGSELKQNHILHKNVWKQHNIDKMYNIFNKAKNLDTFISENF